MITDAEAGLPVGQPVPWLAASLSLSDIAALVLEAAVPRFATAAAMFALEEVLTGDDPGPLTGDDPGPPASDDPGPPASDAPASEPPPSDPSANGAPVAVRRIATGFARDGRPVPDPAFPTGEVMVFAASSPYTACVRGGQPVIFGPQDGQALQRVGYRPAARERMSGYRSYLAIPMVAGQQVAGVLVFARGQADPPFADDEPRQFAGLAARAASYVFRACRPGPPSHPRRPFLASTTAVATTAASATAVATTAALAATVAIAGGDVEVAGHCRAAPGQAVGGDWYDVLALPGGRIGLIIGDAMGHDQSAAAAMMQLRSAAHALAELDLPPAEVLRRLDRTTAALGVVTLATCVYAIIEPAHRSCLIAGAGHLPPVLVHPDGTTSAPELPSGLPIGLGAAIYGQISLPLPPGTALALYTDGLVDTRTRSSQQGIELLRAGLAATTTLVMAPTALEKCCDHLVHSLAPRPEDDTTLVLARIRPSPSPDPDPDPDPDPGQGPGPGPSSAPRPAVAL